MRALRLRVALVPVALLAVVACMLPSPLPPLTPRANSASAKVAADGVNGFAADLYGQLRGGNGNLIVSPYSVSAALALTAAGAEGNTRTEMETVLHLPPGAKVGPAYGAVTNGMNASVSTGRGKEIVVTSQLHVANSLWLQKGHSWKKEYLAVAQDDFHAMLSGADFVKEPEAARARANKWVENQTRDHIKDLLPSGALDADTRLVIANAIYFKARWADEFKKRNTDPKDFTVPGGQKVKAPLMHRTGDYALVETEALQVLKLPYSGGATSMYVLLPRTVDGLPTLEQQLTAENLAKWTAGSAKPEEVSVHLPKFKLTVPTELAAVLQQMGIRQAFDRFKAEFPKMTDDPRGLYISRVVHKAFVELDEEGTEAAAATAVTMSLGATAPPGRPRFVREFRADHPFVFVIKHEATGMPLFVGRVLDPTR